MNEFRVVHNINTNKFCSIAYYFKNTIDHIVDSSIPSVTLVSVKKNPFFRNSINILFIYRKNGLKLDHFIYMIKHILSQAEDNIQLILGDFNYNAFTKDANIEKTPRSTDKLSSEF